ncbi:hypothetical protein [Edaphobacter aggregans]|uniref:hypothetical protein n=1 Tax=Edaphobacter aggregans TaxID=570835 RepID=UPI000552FBBF|nr:hypothetical protein [Edaphobacter aggregans]
MQSSINYNTFPTLTPVGSLIGTAILRHDKPWILQLLGVEPTDPNKELTIRKRWPGEDDMAVRDFQLAMVFLGYDDGETVDALIITLGECSPSALPPKDGPPYVC